MNKKIMSVMVATALVASVFAGCGKEAAVVETTEAAVLGEASETADATETVVYDMQTYLSEGTNKADLESAFQLEEAIAGLSDTYQKVEIAAEGNDLYIDYYFTESICPAENEEAYGEALATSISTIGAATFAPLYTETMNLTGLQPASVGFRYFAASGNELTRISYSAAEMEAVIAESASEAAETEAATEAAAQ